MSRYVVTELEGQLTMASGPFRNGLSCMVVDTARNREVVATYRTEDLRGVPGIFRANLAQFFTYVRELAHEHAERLNSA